MPRRLRLLTSTFLRSYGANLTRKAPISTKAALTMQEAGPPQPWHAAYPTPRHAQPASLTCAELMSMMKQDGQVAGRDFVLVDLRRNDHEGGSIRGSINLPAQSLYPTMPSLYNMFKAAGARKIIWYCSSSRGRGTRAAGWFADYITDRGGDGGMESLVLTGGIKGWATSGDEFVACMDEYDGTAWTAQ